jgi:hypothetical protein
MMQQITIQADTAQLPLTEQFAAPPRVHAEREIRRVRRFESAGRDAPHSGEHGL